MQHPIKSTFHSINSRKSNEFLCRLKYRNTLPAIPIEPKFLRYGFDIQRFTNFTSTTLEKNYIFDLNADLVTCNPIDLVDMSKWSIGDSKKDYSLQAEDAELLKGLMMLMNRIGQNSRPQARKPRKISEA